MMESCFDLKRQGEVSSFCFHVFLRTTMYIIKRIGPKTSPCFTPIVDSISASEPLMESYTMMRCRAMISRMNFGGMPNFFFNISECFSGNSIKCFDKVNEKHP